MAQRDNAGAGTFERFASTATRFTGSVRAFGLAVGVLLVWGITGPLFHFSDTWQLVINTGTTIVTFLMVFLIQQTQNKDGLAIQLKLNELVAALEGASNRLISVEDLTGNDLSVLHAHYQRLAERAREMADTRESHSIDAAERRHRRKADRGVPDEGTAVAGSTEGRSTMADRTHDAENALTGSKTSTTKTPPGAYQEGRVDSVGGGPSGTDREDRSGEGQGRGLTRNEEGRGEDEFMSSEVNERTAPPMKDSKTRS